MIWPRPTLSPLPPCSALLPKFIWQARNFQTHSGKVVKLRTSKQKKVFTSVEKSWRSEAARERGREREGNIDREGERERVCVRREKTHKLCWPCWLRHVRLAIDLVELAWQGPCLITGWAPNGLSRSRKRESKVERERERESKAERESERGRASAVVGS